MSPNMCLPPEHGPSNAIASRVLADPYLTYDVSDRGVVIAIRSELIVSRRAVAASREFAKALERVAEPAGALTYAGQGEPFRPRGARPLAFQQPPPGGPAADVELWRLREPEHDDSIDLARRLRRIADGWRPGQRCGHQPARPPAVSPHHVAILAPKGNGCPAGPPWPSASQPGFITPFEHARVRVTVLDSGYLPGFHPELDERVGFVDGAWFDSENQVWVPDARTDETYLEQADASGELDGLTGHGTFIAGLIAHICPDAEVTVVGLRDQELPLPGGHISPEQQRGLYASEFAIAHAMLLYGDADVIQCGFAFPTLDDYPSLPFAGVIEQFREADREPVIVSPAGNESSRQRYWPAAMPDVIGVAATNRCDRDRAHFSNWGAWCDACSRGEYVHSTFCRFTGAVDGEGAEIETFEGWARWDGTSFAAPQVSALIARRVVDRGLTPRAAWLELQSEALVRGEVIWDFELNPAGVGLPHLG